MRRSLASVLFRTFCALAVIGDRRGALRVGPGRDDVVPEPAGIPGRLLDGMQKETLLALASQWFDLMPPARCGPSSMTVWLQSSPRKKAGA